MPPVAQLHLDPALVDWIARTLPEHHVAATIPCHAGAWDKLNRAQFSLHLAADILADLALDGGPQGEMYGALADKALEQAYDVGLVLETVPRAAGFVLFEGWKQNIH